MKNLSFCILFSLQWLLHLPVYAQPDADTVIVDVQGLGKDAQSAEKNALYSAVEQAVGSYLDSETVIKNEELIHERLLTVAQGFVQKYEVLVPAKERKDGSGIWDVQIRAEVRKSEVGAALRAAGLMQIAADGTAAWAAQITKLKSREDAMALLEKVIPKIPRNLVRCSLVQKGPGIRTSEDPQTGDILAVVSVGMEINLDWWFAEVVPALEASLNALKMNSDDAKFFSLPITTTRDDYDKKVSFGMHESGPMRNIDNFYKYDLRSGSGTHTIKGIRIINQEKLNVHHQGDITSYLPTDLTSRNFGFDAILNTAFKSNQLTCKTYAIPAVWKKQLSNLIANTFGANDKMLLPSFTLAFNGESGDGILYSVDFLFPEIVQINSKNLFVPLFEIEGYGGPDFGHSRLTKMLNVQIELLIDAEILKRTKSISLLSGKYGVATVATPSSSTSGGAVDPKAMASNTLDNQSPSIGTLGPTNGQPLLGVSIESENSLRVLGVVEGSIAEQIGLQSEDVLKSINGIKVSQRSEISPALQVALNSTNLRIMVIRNGKEQSLTRSLVKP
jgi:hypothetical protein